MLPTKISQLLGYMDNVDIVFPFFDLGDYWAYLFRQTYLFFKNDSGVPFYPPMMIILTPTTLKEVINRH